MTICDDVKYVGVNDHEIDLFESQFKVPDGMSYNSYVILDDKIAVMDSVDENFGEQWLENIKNVLKNDADGRIPDYLVVHHMEMDHSANIKKFMENYPDAKIVASKMAFSIMKNLFGSDFPLTHYFSTHLFGKNLSLKEEYLASQFFLRKGME